MSLMNLIIIRNGKLELSAIHWRLLRDLYELTPHSALSIDNGYITLDFDNKTIFNNQKLATIPLSKGWSVIEA